MFKNRLFVQSIFLRPILKRTAFKNLCPNFVEKSCAKRDRYFSHFCIRYNTSMSQKSITSFFKTTPKKENEDLKEKQKILSPTNGVTNGASIKEEKRSSKRQRLESGDSEASSPEKPVQKADKTKAKRQRIESSGSETESSPTSKDKPVVKAETLQASPTHKPTDSIKTPPSTDKPDKKKQNKSPLAKKKDKATTKKELKSVTPKSKKNVKEQLIVKGETNENKNGGVIKKEKVDAHNGGVVKKEKADTQDGVVKKEKVDTQDGVVIKNEKITEDERNKVVPAADYNPAKPKYHPIKDACWSKSEAVPYLALAKTFEAIESISARLKIVEILSNYLRSVIALTPEDLLPSIYMCLNQLAPAYYSLELGIAETYLMKAIGQCTGRSLSQMKSAAGKAGDLGVVAEQARATQRTMFAPPPLTARKVFEALKEIAHMTGQASVNKKIGKIQSLYVACRHSEARYLVRSLEGKLRIGLAEQSVLQALAQATATTPPAVGGAPQVLNAAEGLSQEQFKARVDEHALIIKTTYCECPNYELVVPVLLRHGVAALPEHCRLTPGIPLKPMLAHPTKGVHQIFNRFENEEFTCEWKYDGERAQIHVPSRGEGGGPDFDNASIFSRNQENNTSKYPDVVRRLPALLGPGVHSCVLDCEAVAYDTHNKQILPFQVLSTRKRKDATESEIVVRVCVFVFDLLYLNGRALVRDALADRRALLHEHFTQVEGEWQFATGKDCTKTEEVQQFLEESVRGSCEGLMVKSLRGEHARYDIARRSHNWLKLKKDYLDGVGDTIDVVVIGAYRGRGKRAGTFGGFLLACHDPDTEEYQSLCKIGTGFSDEDLQTLTDTLQQHVIDQPRNYYRFDSSHSPDVWVVPACVWEVRCADLSLSPAHRAAIGLVDPDKGISLRFPRFIRVRDDKSPEQATSAQQIAEMYLAQDQVRNQGTKTTSHDDFY